MNQSNTIVFRIKSALAALAVPCVLALQACALGSGGSSASSATSAPAVAPSYARALSVWRGDALQRPGSGAQVEAPRHDLRTVDASALERLVIGLTENDVARMIGNPAARGDHGLWQYLAKGPSGTFVASIWFNDEHRLWIGATDRAPVSALAASLKAPPVVAPREIVLPAMPVPPVAPPARITLDAKELFDFDSATLRAAQPQLDAMASALTGRHDVGMLVINGYTDRLGSAAYNRALSQRRADAVKNYLVRKGLPADSLRAVGKGSADPVANCQGAMKRAALVECLAPDRRIEIEPLTVPTAAAR
jgi:outer membrane protein OmpA-like peptidoglycan-associated protein